MTSWISHLPPELEFAEVHGLGMNHQELQENQALTAGVQHDLNEDPKLPYADNYFDSGLCAVSVQYLTRPVEVFREVGRILKPDGRFFVSFSHRAFFQLLDSILPLLLKLPMYLKSNKII